MSDDPKKKEKIKASTKDVNVVGELGNYIMNEYVVPKSKDIIHDLLDSFISLVGDAGRGALNKIIYGEDKHPTTSNNRGYYSKPQTNYQSYSKPANSSSSNSVRDPIGTRSSTEVKYVFVDDEESAKELIAGLREICDNYGKVKVSDLYESLNPKVPTNFQDFKFGWTDPDQFGYHKEYTGEFRGKYMIDMPKPINITNI